ARPWITRVPPLEARSVPALLAAVEPFVVLFRVSVWPLTLESTSPPAWLARTREPLVPMAPCPWMVPLVSVSTDGAADVPPMRELPLPSVMAALPCSDRLCVNVRLWLTPNRRFVPVIESWLTFTDESSVTVADAGLLMVTLKLPLGMLLASQSEDRFQEPLDPPIQFAVVWAAAGAAATMPQHANARTIRRTFIVGPTRKVAVHLGSANRPRKRLPESAGGERLASALSTSQVVDTDRSSPIDSWAGPKSRTQSRSVLAERPSRNRLETRSMTRMFCRL